MGIEPTSQAWEARILPMNYARPLKKRGNSGRAPALQFVEVCRRVHTQSMRTANVAKIFIAPCPEHLLERSLDFDWIPLSRTLPIALGFAGCAFA